MSRIAKTIERANKLIIALGWASQVALVVKNLSANAGDWFDPWVGKVSWRRTWQPTPAFLLGKSHGQRNLVGYSPWDHSRI